MKNSINEEYLNMIAKAVYEVDTSVNADRAWEHLYPDDKNIWRERAEAAVKAFLQPIMPSMQNAVNVIVGMHPDISQILQMLDEILQMRVGFGLQSNNEANANPVPQQEASVSFISAEDAAIFAEINELWSPYHEITIEGNAGNRIWQVAIPSIDYTWGIATSPNELLRAVKTSIVMCDNVQEERKNSPVAKEAYRLAGEYNKDIEKHNN